MDVATTLIQVQKMLLKAGYNVEVMRVTILFLSMLLSSVGYLSSAPLPTGSSVFVEDIGTFDELLRAQILKQGLPLDLVAIPGTAAYALRGSASGDLGQLSAAIEIVEISSGKIVWATSSSKGSRGGLWSTDAASKAAKHVVGQLRKAMKARK